MVGHEVVEIESGRVIQRYGLAGERSLGCDPQDGWHAVLAAPVRRIEPITIARFDRGERTPSWSMQLDGSSGGGWRHVYASGAVVWAIRQTPWQEGDIRRYLCGIDAETGDLVSEVDIDLRGRVLVHDGVAWAWSQLPDAQGRPIQTLATALDPGTGEVLAEYDLGSGPAPWPAAGAAGVWCATYNDDGPWVKGVPASDSPLQAFSLTSVDASRFRPPPPPPITVEEAESEALAAIRRDLLIGAHGEKLTDTGRTMLGHDIDVQAVVLEGAFPETRLVVYFRSESRPGYLFGRATRLWEDDGTFDSDYYLAVTVNLQESLIACGHGLPTAPEEDETEVVWF